MTPSWEGGLPAAITHPPLPLRQATGIPSCRLDPKFFSIDLDKCQGLSELAEKVAKNQTVDEVVCEPECANEYKKVGRGRGWAGSEVFVKVTWTLKSRPTSSGPIVPWNSVQEGDCIPATRQPRKQPVICGTESSNPHQSLR